MSPAAIADKPAQRMRLGILIFIFLSLPLSRCSPTDDHNIVIGVIVDIWACSGGRGQTDQIGADLPEPDRPPSRRTSDWEDRSATNTSTRPPPAARPVIAR